MRTKRPVLDRSLYITGWMTGVVHPVTNDSVFIVDWV